MDKKIIKLMQNTFYNELEVKKKLCEFILNSDQLSMGKKCKEFENKFSEYQNRKYSVLFNSGSSANLALIQSLLNLKILNKGDQVGFSGITWATNVMPLLQLGLEAIPVDVSLNNLNVTSSQLKDTLSQNSLNAFFISHILGFSGDINKIKNICEKKNIILLEDTCESLGSIVSNRLLGNFGLASTFSFFVGHHMSTIEGGMVCTDDESIYDMLKLVRAHGWSRDISKEKQEKLKIDNNIGDFHERYTFYFPSYNLRPTEILGFLGVEQLKYLQDINEIRNKNFLDFADIINSRESLIPLNWEHMDFLSSFAIPLIFKNKADFIKYKKEFAKISEIRPIVGGFLGNQPFFKKYLSQIGKKYNCPNAEKIHEVGFYFPNHPELTTQEKELLLNALKEIK